MLELAEGDAGLITACCVALHPFSCLHPPHTRPTHTNTTCSLKLCAPAEQLRLDIDARRREQQALDDAWWAGWGGLNVGVAQSCLGHLACRHITCRPLQLPTLPCPPAALPRRPPRAKHNEEQARAAEAAAKAAEKKKKKKAMKPGADAERAVAAPAAEAAAGPDGGAAAGGDPAPLGEDVAAAAGRGSSGAAG